MFNFGTDTVILWAPDTDPPPTPSIETEPTWAAPALNSFKVIGHSKVPNGHRGLNNSRGRAIGKGEVAYKRRGHIKPGISFQFTPGAVLDFMPNCLRAEGVALNRVAIIEYVFGQSARIYRGCVCSQIEFDLGANNGDGGEVMISTSFEAITSYELTTLPNISRAAVAAIGMPFFWHDVRSFNITGADGVVYGYRSGISSAVLRCAHTLNRGTQRPNYGDNSKLGRCSESINETNIDASGDLTFNQKLTTDQFDGIVNAQNWQDLVTHISDAQAVTTGSKGFTLTAKDLFPADETSGGGDTGSVRTYNVPVTASNLIFTPDA
jgi:hypothetical protein